MTEVGDGLGGGGGGASTASGSVAEGSSREREPSTGGFAALAFAPERRGEARRSEGPVGDAGDAGGDFATLGSAAGGGVPEICAGIATVDGSGAVAAFGFADRRDPTNKAVPSASAASARMAVMRLRTPLDALATRTEVAGPDSLCSLAAGTGAISVGASLNGTAASSAKATRSRSFSS